MNRSLTWLDAAWLMIVIGNIAVAYDGDRLVLARAR